MFGDQLVKKIKVEINVLKMYLKHLFYFPEAKLHNERTDLQYTKSEFIGVLQINSFINIRPVNMNVILCILYMVMHIGFLSISV